jgi:hypothetical protein
MVVVRTLTSLARSAKRFRADVVFLSLGGFSPAPTYSELRLALPRPQQIARCIDQSMPDAIHIATKELIGYLTRAYLTQRGWPFTTSHTTHFSEYVAARLSIPKD